MFVNFKNLESLFIIFKFLLNNILSQFLCSQLQGEWRMGCRPRLMLHLAALPEFTFFHGPPGDSYSVSVYRTANPRRVQGDQHDSRGVQQHVVSVFTVTGPSGTYEI